jgi:putative flippase GtrA
MSIGRLLLKRRLPARIDLSQAVRFCVVGAGNTAVDLAIFFLLTLAGVPYLLAQVLSYCLGMINSFIINRKWTFRVARKTHILDIVKFIMLNGFSLGVSLGTLFIMYKMSHTQLWWSKFLATGCGVWVNFLGSRLWVFSNKKPSWPHSRFNSPLPG